MPVAGPQVLRVPADEIAAPGASDGDDAAGAVSVAEFASPATAVQRLRAPEDAAGPLVDSSTEEDQPVANDPGKGRPHDHRAPSSFEREAELDDLLERLEARLLDEIDRRGGRYGGRF